jgi:hypothetical protein
MAEPVSMVLNVNTSKAVRAIRGARVIAFYRRNVVKLEEPPSRKELVDMLRDLITLEGMLVMETSFATAMLLTKNEIS